MMRRRVITAADVRRAAADGRTVLDVDDDDIVTPLARDDARERGVGLRRVEHAAEPRAGLDGEPAAAGPRPTDVRHIDGRGVDLEPFPFPGPDPGMDVRLRDLVTDADGAPMAAGLMSLHRGSFEWHLDYDEIEYVIEGELRIESGQRSVTGLPGDLIFVPKGTTISFGTPSWAKFLYVTYPAQWTGGSQT